MTKLRLTLVIALMTMSCANGTRDNPFDPANTPAIEADAPVIDDGSVFITWRYLNSGGQLLEFVIRKAATSSEANTFPSDLNHVADSATANGRFVPTGISLVGKVASMPGDDWQSGAIRDPEVPSGIRILYQVAGLSDDGTVLSSVTVGIRFP